MRKLFYAGLILLASSALALADDPFADNIRKTEALTPEQELKSFHLPDGFQIQLIASEPQIHKPLDLNFDSRGRLWMTQTHMYPFAAKPGKPMTDSILVLEDVKGDGSFSKITTFAENLSIPMGIYPVGDGHSVIAYDCGDGSNAGIGETCLYTDTDGDGKADKKEVLYTGWSYARDTHGMSNNYRRGFDGWIYGLHGFNNISDVKGSDGFAQHFRSGNSYRFRMDGSHIEIFTEGQINPHGLCMDALGNTYDSDSHSKPIYQLLRGGKYEAFDRNCDDGLGLAPMMMHHLHGSTAIAGSQIYADDKWPEEYQGNFLTGNVVTCRIDRDKIEYHGSTPKAIEMPDFLASDDPWFRPDALYLGPDGALYVSDFYNRIIGHYEVPLTDPRRDYERGRLWRISYKATKPRVFDISKSDAPQLIAALNDTNLTARILAMNELSDRLGKDAVDPVTAMLKDSKSTSLQKAHGLWVLFRLNALPADLLTAAAKDSDPMVRTHAMRILAETNPWSSEYHELALATLKDTDALTRRCAADALGMHPDAGNVPALMAMLESADKDDTHLVYVTEMALRNQLSAEGSYAKLGELSPDQVRLVARMSLAVPTAESSVYILQHIGDIGQNRDQVTQYLQHAVRYAQASNVAPLATLMREKYPDDLDLQLESYQSIRQALDQRGEAMPDSAKQWGESLVKAILEKGAASDQNWTVIPSDKTAPVVSQWNYEVRHGGGKELKLLSSLPGGESATSVIRSKPFVVPAKLSFWMCGHNSPPSEPDTKKNFARLKLVDGDKTIAQALPPRNDNAHKVNWKLDKYVGQQAYLEFTDGDNGPAFAWLAFGGFDPPVVPMPDPAPMALQQRLRFAAIAAGESKLSSVAEPLRTILATNTLDTETRAAAATARSAIGDDASVAPMTKIVGDSTEVMPLRQKVAIAMGQIPSARDAIIAGFTLAPGELQMSLAQSLTSNAVGGEALLDAIKASKAPAQLLFVQQIHDRLAALSIPDLEKRIKTLTQGVAAPKEEMEKLLNARRAAYRAADPASLNPAAGQAIAAKNCIVCHQIDGKGALVGPQLAGLNKRGLDRLVEDILDPNRNVDPAFRYSNVFLKNGTVVTGLQKREEGETLIFVDSTAKEIRVNKSDIQRRFESPGSLMPSNFAEIIKPEDFNNLLAYLLSK